MGYLILICFIGAGFEVDAADVAALCASGDVTALHLSNDPHFSLGFTHLPPWLSSALP
jgi:hypothetical protein